MIHLCFYDTKPYDRVYFDAYAPGMGVEIEYLESKLTRVSAVMARGADAVCAFVNDTIDAAAIETLCENGVKLLALRCAGYNNVDLRAAAGRLTVARVPAYSPHAVAEHAMALLLTLVRKTHRAYNRTRDYNFNLTNLTGFDLYGKTIGVVGTGRIGRTFIRLCAGFGMRTLAYDPFPVADAGAEYVPFDRLCAESDIISLHCPLTRETHHLVNRTSIAQMKPGVVLINTSRGALIDASALLDAIRSQRVGAAGLDVYEEETEFFYEDYSETILSDEVLTGLLSLPNVLVTSHQAFLTREALEAIARTTLANVTDFFAGKPLENEVRLPAPRG